MEAKPTAVHVETNAETMMEARVYANNTGFTVTLVDLDSGETVPTMRRVASLEAALSIAKSWPGSASGPFTVAL